MAPIRRFPLAWVLLSISVTAAAAGAKNEIVWQNNFDAALKLAQTTGKPLLIDFWASWCGPCKAMDSNVWPDKRLAETADRYVFALVDTDKDKGTMRRYLVRGIPSVVVADPWGHAVASHLGYVEPLDIIAMMNQLPSDYGAAKDWFDLLERDGKNARALSHVGQFYADRHAFGLSTSFFNDALKTSAAKENDVLREDLELAIAVNQLRNGSLSNARKRLEQFLHTYPNGRRQDEALAALIAVSLKQGRRADAERSLQDLQQRFPESRATATALQLMSRAKP